LLLKVLDQDFWDQTYFLEIYRTWKIQDFLGDMGTLLLMATAVRNILD